MNKALPMVRWGGNAQEMLLFDILNSLNYQQFVILPSNIETDFWMDNMEYIADCDRRRWIDDGGPAYAYIYKGLIIQCTRCARQFAMANSPTMNAITQPAMGDDIEGPVWDDAEQEAFINQCKIIGTYRETMH
jgi:hypothetical protein